MNLPAKIKSENPEYLALQADELPLIKLGDNAGSIKVVDGEYEGQSSSIPTYSKQFLFHIRLNGGKQFTLPTDKGLEYALFLPQNDLTINNKDCHAGDLIGFKNEAGNIEILNSKEAEADIILFGGQKYTEPFVAQGPFVMSTQQEIYQANSDYQNGKYGEIIYN